MGSERDFRTSTRIRLENRLHDCQNNGFRGRPAFRELRNDISGIVPNVASDFNAIDTYYGEVNRGINQLFSDITRVVRQANQCEDQFVRELDRELRRARYLRDALLALNRLIDPRRVSGGKSLIEGSSARFQSAARDVEVALAGKIFESMVKRDANGNITGYRWDIIENILNKDAVNISEAQFAALARMFLGMNNLGDKERFLNTLADRVEWSGSTTIAGHSFGYMYTFCQDKLAGIMRHAGDFIEQFRVNQVADCGQSNAERQAMLHRLGLLAAVSEVLMVGSPPPTLLSDGSGPITLTDDVAWHREEGTWPMIRLSATTWNDNLASGGGFSVDQHNIAISAPHPGECPNTGRAVRELAYNAFESRHSVDDMVVHGIEVGTGLIVGEVPGVGTALSFGEAIGSMVNPNSVADDHRSTVRPVNDLTTDWANDFYDVVIIESAGGSKGWSAVGFPSTRNQP